MIRVRRKIRKSSEQQHLNDLIDYTQPKLSLNIDFSLGMFWTNESERKPAITNQKPTHTYIGRIQNKRKSLVSCTKR